LPVSITVTNPLPTISAIFDQNIAQDTTTGQIPFTIGDTVVPVSTLTVNADSSNKALLPNANIFIQGSGPNRTVILVPAAGQTGLSTVTLTVQDQAGLSANTTFNLRVIPVNHPPTVSLLSPADGASFTAPAAVPIAANASDSDGSIAKVEFFQG